MSAGLGVAVEARDGESTSHLLRRFGRQVTQAQIFSDLRRHRWALTRGERRRRKLLAAAARREKLIRRRAERQRRGRPSPREGS